jgi:hypothetical protein
MELLKEHAADSLALPLRVDVDSVELRLRAFAVVVEEADDPAGLLGHEEVGVLTGRAARHAFPQGVECVALLDDRRKNRLVTDEILVRLRDRDRPNRSDARGVRRKRVAHDRVRNAHCPHEGNARNGSHCPPPPVHS